MSNLPTGPNGTFDHARATLHVSGWYPQILSFAASDLELMNVTRLPGNWVDNCQPIRRNLVRLSNERIALNFLRDEATCRVLGCYSKLVSLNLASGMIDVVYDFNQPDIISLCALSPSHFGNPDVSRILSGGRYGHGHIWEADTGLVAGTVHWKNEKGHTDQNISLRGMTHDPIDPSRAIISAYKPDGHGSAGLGVRLYDLERLDVAMEFVGWGSGQITCLGTFVTDGKLISAGYGTDPWGRPQGGRVRMWDRGTGRSEGEVGGDTYCSMCCCEEKNLVIVGASEGMISAYDVRQFGQQAVMRTRVHEEGNQKLSAFPGAVSAIIQADQEGNEFVSVAEQDNGIVKWNVESGTVVKKVEMPPWREGFLVGRYNQCMCVTGSL